MRLNDLWFDISSGTPPGEVLLLILAKSKTYYNTIIKIANPFIIYKLEFFDFESNIVKEAIK